MGSGRLARAILGPVHEQTCYDAHFVQIGDMLLGAPYTPRPLSTSAEVALPPTPLAELVHQVNS